MILKQSYYTKHMYAREVNQWEAFHEGEVYNDKKAQEVEDRIQLKKKVKRNAIKKET